VTVRRNQRRSGLSATLPDELRSFDGWYYPGGLHDYMQALSRFVGDDQRITPVMSAAGLSAADWFRAMLSDPERWLRTPTSLHG
jgi:hypothetical protein